MDTIFNEAVSGDAGNDKDAFPNVSETFGNVRNVSERTAHHTLSVRDTAKIFESATFPLTERTVINWCNQNRHGIKRLDCFFDEQEVKYFITPHSVDKALKEEAEKNAHDTSIYDNFSERFGKTQETVPNVSETFPKESIIFPKHFGNVPHVSEHDTESPMQDTREGKPTIGVGEEKRVKELEQEVLELRILNKWKDYFIDQLKQDRQYVFEERAQLVAQLTNSVKQIGVLETKLMQLEAPRERIIEGVDGEHLH